MKLVQLFTLVGFLGGCIVENVRTRRDPQTLIGGIIGAVLGIDLLVLYVYSGL